ncbi:uncharacterized protein AAES06_019499 isoform 2-T4 [Glossophaga mutica]
MPGISGRGGGAVPGAQGGDAQVRKSPACREPGRPRLQLLSAGRCQGCPFPTRGDSVGAAYFGGVGGPGTYYHKIEQSRPKKFNQYKLHGRRNEIKPDY